MLRLNKFSYRFGEQVLNSKLALKQEIESTLTDEVDITSLSRPKFNELLDSKFKKAGWQCQPPVFDEPDDPAAKMDFMKERVGIEVAFGHSSFIGIDLLKFQVASYSALNKIDVGIYVVTTKAFQNRMMKEYKQNWASSLSYEKVQISPSLQKRYSTTNIRFGNRLLRRFSGAIDELCCFIYFTLAN